MASADLSALIDKVRDWNEAEAPQFTVEQMGMLVAFVRSRQSVGVTDDREKLLLSRIAKAIKSWQSTYQEQDPSEMGKQEKRNQLLLRAAVSKFKNREYDDLTQEDLELVRGTVEGMESCKEHGPSTVRLRRILTNSLKEYERHLAAEKARTAPAAAPARAAAVEREQDTSPLDEHAIVAAEFFKDGAKRAVKTLADIEVGLIVKSYELDGNVLVEGDIPDDTLLVVRRGGATIKGHVFGYLVATQDILIDGNVQGGWVVSSEGSITVKRLLTGAHVVAQMGGLRCESMESPEIAFARERLEVSGAVLGGALLSRDIDIGGDVRGANIHTVGEVTGQSFAPSHSKATVLCLRQVLTSEDYGRPMSPATLQLKRLMAKHNYNTTLLACILEYTVADVWNCQRSMLYYLLGGITNRMTLCLLRGAQSQVLYLDALIGACQNLSAYLHSLRTSGHSVEAEDVGAIADDCLRSMRGIDVGIRSVPDEFGAAYKGTLVEASREFRIVCERLSQATKTTFKVSGHLKALDKALAKWEKRLAASAGEADKLVNQCGLDTALVSEIEQQTLLLGERVEGAIQKCKSSSDAEDRQRADSAFIRLMHRGIALHHTNMERWNGELEREMGQLERVRTELAGDPSILLWDPDSGPVRVRADSLESGVVLTTSPGMTQGSDVAEAAVIQISSPVKRETVFSFNGRTIRRELVASAPT